MVNAFQLDPFTRVSATANFRGYSYSDACFKTLENGKTMTFSDNISDTVFFFSFFSFFFLMGSSSPTPIPFFFFFFFILSFFFFFFFFRFFRVFFVFFFFFRQNNFKISKLQIKIANQSGTHTMPKHATFHPPMHSYHVFHRRVERPSIADIGCAPEVALKKRRVLQNVGHHRRFLKVKSDIELTRTILFICKSDVLEN